MAEQSTMALAYAVRWKVLAKYFGQLALLLAVLMLAPLIVSLLENEYSLAPRYILLIAILLSTGLISLRLPAPERIQINEALTITVLAFLGAALLMSWPMMESGVSYMDAVFESISGVTTTGLSTLASIEGRSHTFLFARAWMQWYGGLGFIVLSVALLLGNQTASRRLVGQAVVNEPLIATARTHALRTLIVYVCLTVVGLLLAWPAIKDGFTALLYILSAVSTGGFAPHNDSLAELNSRAAAIIVMVISFLSAVSLHLYWKVVHSGWSGGIRIMLTDMEFRALLLACLLTGSVLTLLAWIHNAGSPWYNGFMIGFSAQTTTGFATLDVASMDAASKLVMILSMLTGGSVGSSAGGFKILRLLILLRAFQMIMRRSCMPLHAMTETYLGGQKLELDEVTRALQLVLLFIAVIVLSWFPFVAYGYDPLNSLFDVVSACGTVGLSSGVTGPHLETPLKAVLCFDMLAGRVEIVALLIILYPRTWFGRRDMT